MTPNDLACLARLRSAVSKRFADVARDVTEILCGDDWAIESDARDQVRSSIEALADRLCGTGSVELPLMGLIEESGLGLGEVFGVIGILQSRIEQCVDGVFDRDEGLEMRAALRRRVIVELSLLGATAPSDSSVRVSLFDRDSVTEAVPPAAASHHGDARTAAHEIRNALNGASLHLTFVERSLEALSADEETLQAAKVIAKEIERVAELVAASLELPREAPAGEATVSLRAVCEQALAHVAEGIERPRALAPESGLAVKTLLELLQDVTESALQSAGRVLLTARRHPAGAIVEIEHGQETDDGEAPDRPASLRGAMSAGFDSVCRAVAAQGGVLRVDDKPGRTTFHLRLPDPGDRAVNL